MTYIQAKGELLVILDGMTSREQGMAEICPNNPPELSESQCTPNEHSRTGISVVLLAKPHPNNPRLKFKNIVFPVPSYPSQKRKREGKGESKESKRCSGHLSARPHPYRQRKQTTRPLEAQSSLPIPCQPLGERGAQIQLVSDSSEELWSNTDSRGPNP